MPRLTGTQPSMAHRHEAGSALLGWPGHGPLFGEFFSFVDSRAKSEREAPLVDSWANLPYPYGVLMFIKHPKWEA